MFESIKTVPNGTVTSVKGFEAGAIYAGVNKNSPYRLDVGILYSDTACKTAALFTKNKVKAAPVLLCQQLLPSNKIHAVMVNSGIANACTGQKGFKDALKINEMVARAFELPVDSVLNMSTGVIGKRLPLEQIQKSLPHIKLSNQGGHDFARAIMTTDTCTKEIAVRVEDDMGAYTIGGVAKGAGMIAPNMATTLCFLTTDASIETETLRLCLRKATGLSFNMISVDGDTSTNDTIMMMSNGRAGNAPINVRSRRLRLFQHCLNEVCIYLAKRVASDGEGATKLITVTVIGAVSHKEARQIARTVVSSNLVKTAVHGADPNWGRIFSAAGRSGATFDETIAELKIGSVELWGQGAVIDFDIKKVREELTATEVAIELKLNIGNGKAVAWGCDLSREYVTINSEYTT